MVCVGLVGVITEQSCLFPDLTWWYQWYEILPILSPLHLSPSTAIFVVDCCQFGPSWIFGLKMELMACASLVGGTTEQSCFFPWPYMIVSIIWITSKLSPYHLCSVVTPTKLAQAISSIFSPKIQLEPNWQQSTTKMAVAWLRCNAEISEVFHIIDTII